MYESEQIPISPEQMSQRVESTPLLLGRTQVVETTTGLRLAWNDDKTELRINTTLYSGPEEARLVALCEVAEKQGLIAALKSDPEATLTLAKQHPKAANSILRWQGLHKLRSDAQEFLPGAPLIHSQPLEDELYTAIDTYALTGKFPDKLSPKVAAVLAKIPQSQGKNVIDYIVTGRYLPFDGENYARYLQPLFDELGQDDMDSGRSQKFEYRPSQREDLNQDKEQLSEDDIQVKVSPFYGGYYRENVCRYDPVQQKIVQDELSKNFFRISEYDLPKDSEAWATRHKYEGIFPAGEKSIALKLPYNALPLTTTAGYSFQFDRDPRGLLSLQRYDARKTEPFSFEFLIVEHEQNRLGQKPTTQEQQSAGYPLDQETEIFITDLAQQTKLTDVAKAKEIVQYLRKKLRYPNDEAEMSQMDGQFLKAGKQLMLQIMETGVANCYWSNILRDELCKRIGIASRIPTGPYVGTKDPRFTYAVVEAPGLVKHAWGEVWDPETKLWTHRGMDATPPKRKDDTEESEYDQPTEPLEGDFGGSQEEQDELTPEEIEQLYQELLSQQLPEEEEPPEIDLNQRARAQFEQEKGLPFNEWHKLETFIREVNETPVSAEHSISHRPSTIQQEWRELFDLLYKRREVPNQTYKGPVRQSEGEFLDDPVTAYIDVRSRDEDPLGYQRRFEKPKEEIEVSEVDDDFLLDLSGSMHGQPLEELKKMVLSSSFNQMKINERFQNTQIKSKMKTPLLVRTTQLAFDYRAREIVNKDEKMSEKTLVRIQKELSRSGGSDLLPALQAYRDSLDDETLKQIKEGKRTKIVTIISDGMVMYKDQCTAIIKELRDKGVIVQGIGFGSSAQDIRVICHDPNDPESAAVIEDVTQATLVRHKMLMKHLRKL